MIEIKIERAPRRGSGIKDNSNLEKVFSLDKNQSPTSKNRDLTINIRKERQMTKELTRKFNKYKDGIVVNELTLVIEVLNREGNLEKYRDELVEQLIEIREFVQRN